MSVITFIHGEKGGVGKSIVAKTAVQYRLDKEQSFCVFECDRSNPDVMRTYKSVLPCRIAVFSESPEHEDSANALYNQALKQDVLVNLPAQVSIPLRNFFVQNELLAIAPEDGIRFQFLYVSDGGFDSLHLFRKTVETFGAAVSYIFVKNLGRCAEDDWSAFDEDTEMQALLSQYHIPVLYFPRLIGNADRNRIDQLSLTFGQAREYKKFTSISKQRIKSFLRQAYDAFDLVGVFAV